MTVYTFQEACDHLRIKRNTMYKLIDSGEVKGFKIGKLRRFTDEELDKYVRAQMKEEDA